MTDETRPDAVTEPAPTQTPPPVPAPAAPSEGSRDSGDAGPGEDTTTELADTTNPGGDLDPADAKLANLNPDTTPNPYTGDDTGPQDDEAVQEDDQ